MNNNNKTTNTRLKKNTFIFGILMIICQTGIVIAYSLGFIVTPSSLNVSSAINTVMLAILVVAGFGLVFSYIRRLIWSGIGFTFFITAFCIVLYPIVNNFWTRTAIKYNTTAMNFQNNKYYLYLANAGLPSSQLYGNTITNALKCALAVAAAFSSIVGRVGPLECLITVIFGTVGYQLNRQVISNISVDGFGTYTIFTFAGFMGLALGFILRLKEDRMEETSTQMNTLNIGSDFSALYSLLGSLIIFALFPILAYQIDVTNNFNVFNLRNGPISIIIGMGASVGGAFCISMLIHGNVILRDIIHGPIAGGIVVGSSSFFITNPVYALVAGFIAGAIQSLIQSIEKYLMRTKSVVSTVSWTLFGIQGLIGGVFATGYKVITDSHTNGFPYTDASKNFNPGYQLLSALISGGIGVGFGIISGIIIYFVSAHRSEDHFSDKVYWQADNGIGYAKVKQIPQSKPTVKHKQEKPPNEQTSKKSEKDKDVPEQHSEVLSGIPNISQMSEFQFQMQFSQPSEMQAYYHAYL